MTFLNKNDYFIYNFLYILTVIVIFVLLQNAGFNLQIDGTFDLLNPSNIVVEFEVFDDFTIVIVNELLWI